MVAVRRIKHLVQLSAAGLFVLTLLIFVQWDDISYNTRFKRRFGLSEHQELLNDEELTALERELDVDRVLKKIQNDVLARLKIKEEKENNETQKEILRNLQQQHDKNGKDSEDSTSTSFLSAGNPFTDPVVNEATPISKPTADKSRDLHNRKKKASREREHRRHVKKFKWKTYPWQPRMRGQLNVHVWQAWCGNTIHDLRRNWFFPSYPDLHLTVRRFYVQHYENDYGQRIFGYIHPPLTGKYIFALSSDDTSELWLSKNENPENVKLIAWVGNLTSLGGSHKTNIAEFTKYNTQLSRQIYLKKGQRYFIEALHKQGNRRDHILVGWKIPGLAGFRYITGDSISMYVDHDSASADVTQYAKYIPQTMPSHTHSHTWSVVLDREVHRFGLNDEPDIEYHNRDVELKSFDNILPNCTYEPSYLVNFTLRRYDGVKLIHDSAVYPNDNTMLTHMKPYDRCLARRSKDSHGNKLKVTNPKLTNHSLYQEGIIKVFGESSVVTKSSDLSEDYPIENFIDGRSSEKPMPQLAEQKRILSEIYNETNDLSPNEDEAIQSNDPRDSYYGNTNQINVQNGKYDPQIRGASSSLSKSRQPNTNDVIPIKERRRNDVPKREAKAPLQNGKYDPQIRGASSSLSKDRRPSTNDVIPIKERRNDVVPKREAKAPNSRQRKSIHTIKAKVQERKTFGERKKVHKQMLQKKRSSEEGRVKSIKNILQPMDAHILRKNPHILRKDDNILRKDDNILRKDDHILRKDDHILRKDDHTVRNNRKRSVTPNKRQSNSMRKVSLRKPASQDLQRKPTNQDLYRRHGNDVIRVDDDDYQRANQMQAMDQGVNTATLRKLMFYQSKNNEQRNQVQSRSQSNINVERNVEAQIQSAKRTKVAVPVLNFRSLNLAKRNRSIPEFLYEDAKLSRLNTAQEYVRRMQRVVQAYQYPMSGKQLSDQIYRRYGVNMTVHGMLPYMNYNPWIYHHNTTKCTTDGNILFNEIVAKSVVSRYMKELNKKIPNTYTLERIINIQENHDVLNGDRYLMELELVDRRKGQNIRLSQYIYQKIGETHLCLPRYFQIKPHATVHVIVPVKNQGRWVQYFIDDMSELYLKTGDPHLNVIIVDFSSNDIDVEAAFKRSALVRYRVITLTGPFQRAFGIQAGAAIVKNPNDIIFMCDLHLEVPNNMISIIRKHCIQGRMAFAPIVLRLHCGFTPSIPYGFWELQGYGLFAMYKFDFSRVGGMNYREFGTRWGGEDWELLDRVLLHKMEVERLRIPNFYHFYHSKKGMWGSPTIDTISSEIPQYYRNKKQIIPLYIPRVRMVSISNPPTYSNRHRNLRDKRSPSRVIRPASRVRRGYRPKRVPNPPRPIPKEIY